MRVLLTRPAEDAAPLARSLMARGHEVLIDPMIEIVDTASPLPDLAPATTLIFTSANGVRAWIAKSGRRDLPAFTVGDHTREAAVQAGFSRVTSAGGNVKDLYRRLVACRAPDEGHFLHVAGEVVAGDLVARLSAAGYAIERYAAYGAEPAPMLAPATVAALAERRLDGILFYSPRTARHFAALVESADLAAATDEMTAFCLSPAVAAAARALPFGRVDVAARPEQAALLELLS